MQAVMPLVTGGGPTGFVLPSGVIDRVICSTSGAEASEWCPSERAEFFAEDQPPLPKEKDLWQKPWVDSFSLLLASTACPDFAVQKLRPGRHRPWAQMARGRRQGKDWAEDAGFEEEELFFIPHEVCTEETPRPVVGFTDPAPGTVISDTPVELFGRAAAPDDFRDWVLEYGVGNDPNKWPDLARGDDSFEQPGHLFTWNPTGLPNGPVTLRLTVRSRSGGKASALLHLVLDLPAPTATPTLTPTSTSVPSDTPTPTFTPSPTSSETPTPTP
jgi:hypothetical protein